jgi:hypothetical protein
MQVGHDHIENAGLVPFCSGSDKLSAVGLAAVGAVQCVHCVLTVAHRARCDAGARRWWCWWPRVHFQIKVVAVELGFDTDTDGISSSTSSSTSSSSSNVLASPRTHHKL